MVGDQLTTKDLAKAVGELESTISFWARQGLLVFERTNGRTRLFPAEENIARIRFIKDEQRRPEGRKLTEINAGIKRGLHRSRKTRGSKPRAVG